MSKRIGVYCIATLLAASLSVSAAAEAREFLPPSRAARQSIALKAAGNATAAYELDGLRISLPQKFTVDQKKYVVSETMPEQVGATVGDAMVRAWYLSNTSEGVSLSIFKATAQPEIIAQALLEQSVEANGKHYTNMTTYAGKTADGIAYTGMRAHPILAGEADVITHEACYIVELGDGYVMQFLAQSPTASRNKSLDTIRRIVASAVLTDRQ